jgi:hypothetical protein
MPCCGVLFCAADLRGQSAQAARLGEQLAKGPLAEVAASLSPLLTVITEGTQVRQHSQLRKNTGLLLLIGGCSQSDTTTW